MEGASVDLDVSVDYSYWFLVGNKGVYYIGTIYPLFPAKNQRVVIDTRTKFRGLRGIWGSYYSIPKVRFYLLKGDYNPKPYTLNSSFHFLFHYPYITPI